MGINVKQPSKKIEQQKNKNTPPPRYDEALKGGAVCMNEHPVEPERSILFFTLHYNIKCNKVEK